MYERIYQQKILRWKYTSFKKRKNVAIYSWKYTEIAINTNHVKDSYNLYTHTSCNIHHIVHRSEKLQLFRLARSIACYIWTRATNNKGHGEFYYKPDHFGSNPYRTKLHEHHVDYICIDLEITSHMLWDQKRKILYSSSVSSSV